MAVGGAPEQDAVGAEAGGFLAQLAQDRVHLVLLAVGERAAGGLEDGDLLVAARRRAVVDAHLRGIDRRARGAGEHVRGGAAGQGQRKQQQEQRTDDTHGGVLVQRRPRRRGADGSMARVSTRGAEAGVDTARGAAAGRAPYAIAPLTPITWPLT